MVGNGHPFYLKSTSSTSGTNNEYTLGVVRNGSINSGSNGDSLVFTVPNNAPDNLWYQCSAHSGMLGKLNILNSKFNTNSSGSADFTGIPSGNYTAGFTVTNSSHLDASVDIFDVLAILDYTTGSVTPNADQIVAANVLRDTTDMASKLDIFDVLRALDMSTGTYTPGETILRDASASAATYNSDTSVITNYSHAFSIQPGYDIELKSYLLGDVDGDYASLI